MLKDGFGSDVDAKGVSMTPKYYLRGTEHQVCDGLAHAFVSQLGFAQYVDEAKDEGPAPENKMQKPRANRKSRSEPPKDAA